ncbi:MAG: hypothetical protein DDT32_01390 [Syntrophomonadaceae bacterium]|nr:hypothetical protein [Bacillota bacterium]
MTCLEVIEHLYNFDYVALEMQRVLKPNGVLYISTPSKLSSCGALGPLAVRDPSHVNLRSKKLWIKTFELLGFCYEGEFPRAKRKKAVNLIPQSTTIAKILVKVGMLPIVPSLRYDLIFRKCD